MPPRSDVWRFYVKRGSEAICKICDAEIKTSGNTTNLRKHLKKHPETETQNPPSKRPRLMENVDDPPLVSSSQPSVVHETNENSNDIPSTSNQDNLAVIETVQNVNNGLSRPSTSNVEKRQTRIDTTFNRIMSFRKGGEKEQKVTNAILYMIVKDNMPLQTTDKEGFKYMMNVTNPHYKVPSRKTISRMLEGKYEVLSSKIKEKLKNTQNVTVTTDIWTNKQDQTSYLGVTLHFLCEGSMQVVTVGVFPLDEKHTAKYIEQKLRDTFEEWNIPIPNISCIVTDGAKNMILAVSSIVGSNKHLICYAHMLNLVVTGALANAKPPPPPAPTQSSGEENGMIKIIDKVKKIVRFFKHSCAASSALKRSQAPSPALKLKQSVPTRWNSTYYMLERFILLASKVSGIIMEIGADVEMVTTAELDVLREAAEVLQPFEEVCREISTEKYLSTSKVIPLTSCIQEKISRTSPTSTLGKILKESLKKEMSSRFDKLEFSSILGISTLLDPRFKKLHFKNPLAVGRMVTYINNLLSANSPTVSESSTENAQTPDDSSIWAYHSRLHAQSLEHTMQLEGVEIEKEELRRYFLKPIEKLYGDPIKYWINEAGVSPALSQVALKYLTTVGSSVPCERLFSKAGQIASDSRNRLSGGKLNMLLFLNSVDVVTWDL